jgi:hypothetical protein
MKTLKTLALIGLSLSVLSAAASAKSVGKLPTSVYNKVKLPELVGPPVGPGGPKVRVIVRQ